MSQMLASRIPAAAIINVCLAPHTYPTQDKTLCSHDICANIHTRTTTSQARPQCANEDVSRRLAEHMCSFDAYSKTGMS